MRIAIGMAVTAVALAAASRRFWWIGRLVRSGQPAPGRFGGLVGRIWVELIEVAGQKKLLKWTVPGIAHFATMWGFTVLLLTVIEAYGDFFTPSFAIPGDRAQPGAWSGGPGESH